MANVASSPGANMATPDPPLKPLRIFSGFLLFVFCKSHTFTVESSPALARNLPSDETDTVKAIPSCASKLLSFFPAPASQRDIHPSSPAVASQAPSIGENWTQLSPLISSL